MTSAEAFLGRVGERVGAGWEVLIPMILDAIMAIIANCQTPEVVDACRDMSRAQRRQVRREAMATAIKSRRENGWGIIEAARKAADAADKLCDEAEATVNGDEAPRAGDIVEEFKELSA